MKKSVIKQLKTGILDLGRTEDWVTGATTLAVSISNHTKRATVNFIQAMTFRQAWDQVADELASVAGDAWVRIEVVQSIQKRTLASVEAELRNMDRMNYWRRGISFDPKFKTALLEMELNGHAFIKPGEGHRIGKNKSASWLDFDHITTYLRHREGQDSLDLAAAKDVWVFTTTGIFTDGDQIWRLNDTESPEKGIRQLVNFKSEFQNYLGLGEQFLARQIKANGQFVYGYYPARQRVLSNYNSVRHFSSIYALLEAIDFTGRKEDLAQVKQAIQWGLEERTQTVADALFVVERPKKGTPELKLGAQAMLILALCKYQEVTHDETFAAAAMQAFRGVVAFQQASGRFNHVLNPDLTVKDAFRIIYYEGEITFALARLYEMTHEQAVLAMVQTSLDFMIANDYGKYHDHWISYAVNEALQFTPDNRELMRLGLKNVFSHLDFIEQRDTAYPTLLELLDAAVKMTDIIRETGNDDLMNDDDVIRLRRVWRQRAEHELATGAFQPELAMYFYAPSKFVGGFFARHDHFRTRIDDCEHFLSGLINYYNYAY
ncbi:glycosyl transferase family 1 [Levilactobacillus yiduensis]|uniref:glycosyl transferase family 1 n=1 Tax=Levilactobacillus yiduensis TaxID=2953880 RepID=UPI000EF33536|nr:glycosyl transferase family 1 [Levilactobacillus yiduensis]AYM02950.1 glycosyl transferase family 1 [Levilactobacillus brevis]